jgi:hypothetical protein
LASAEPGVRRGRGPARAWFAVARAAAAALTRTRSSARADGCDAAACHGAGPHLCRGGGRSRE